jgi:hypothetical protein
MVTVGLPGLTNGLGRGRGQRPVHADGITVEEGSLGWENVG